MAQSIQRADSETPLGDLNAMLVSAACHMAALISLGLLTTAGTSGWHTMKLLVSAESRDAVSLDASSLEDTGKADATTEAVAGSVAGPTRLFEPISSPAGDFAALNSLAGGAPIGGEFDGSALFGSGFEGLATVGSGSDGAALGGNGDLEGARVRATTKFFGIDGYGQTFIYVVDCSGSMSEAGKFDRARYELLHSIEQLCADQKYFIIFFNHQAHPMDAAEPVTADQDQLARTVQWVSYVEPAGGTNPLPALVGALSMHPDAIYFLSDGEFDPATVTILRQQNKPNRQSRRAIPIHTIAFMDRSMEWLMRTIAKNSGGEYRFVK